MTDDEKTYIWIARWEEFQHYKPERDRPPAFIKDYPKQLDDDRYRDLTLHLRGLLASLRQAFSKAGAKLELDRSKLSARVGATVYQRDLERLNHAGFIEFISRATLEWRLEKLYARARPRAREEEESKDSSKTARARAPYNGARSRSKEVPPPPAVPCPECGVGGGYHVTDCSKAKP